MGRRLGTPEAVTASLFEDLIVIAGTDRFPPHDKDRRWASRKTSIPGRTPG